MVIRKLTLADSAELASLIKTIEETLVNKAFWLPIKAEARMHFFDNDWTDFYGCFHKERLVGAAALFYNKYEYGESLSQLNVGCRRIAEVGRAMVHPDYRGNNILYQINLHLVKVAKSRDIEMLLSTIHPDNMPSQKSFKKLGMEKQCTYMKNDGFMRDIYTMEI